MASFNKVILMGNLTRDPEIRQAGKTGIKVCQFGLAMNESRKDASGQVHEYPCFVDIEAWDKLAELCGQYLKKGRGVLVEGRLQQDTWEKDGQKRSKLKVRASTVKFLPQPAAPSGARASAVVASAAPVPASAAVAAVPPVPPAEGNELAGDSDDLPF